MGLNSEEKKRRSQVTANIPTFGPDIGTPQPYVFISYKSDDWEVVLDKLVRTLVNKHGLRVYFDKKFNEDNAPWVDNMRVAMASNCCKAVIACVSKNYVRSYACAMELMQARSRDVYIKHNKKVLQIIPVIVDNSETIEKAVESVSSIKVNISEWNSYQKIVDSSIGCRLNKDTDFLEVLQNLKQQGDNVREDDLAALIQNIETHERRFDDPQFEPDIITTLQKEAGTVVFDTSLINSCPAVTNETDGEVKPVAAERPEHKPEPVRGTVQPDPIPVAEKTVVAEAAAQKETEPAKPMEAEEPAGVKSHVVETKKTVDEPDGEEETTGGTGRGYSVTGDITYTLYGRTYTENQSNMMLRFFAQVLKRHPDQVEGLPEQRGMNCASSVDYTDPANQTKEMPSYFRNCRYFDFGKDGGICIGTAYGSSDKLRKMSMLLAICGEDPAVFQSEQVELPQAGGARGGRGNSDMVNYTVYGENFTTNQTDMMGNIFNRVLERHPDQLNKIAQQTAVVALEDYSSLPKAKRPGYFATLNVYQLNGQTYSVGAGLKMQDKLKQVARLLAICGEPVSVVHVKDYEIEEVTVEGSSFGGRGNSDAVSYAVYGKQFSSNQTDMIGNIFSCVLERHPDKLAEAAEQTYVVALEDYSKVPRAERPAYFATLNTYELNGQTYSVGAGLKMQDKLKQVARLLALCGEPVYSVVVQGYQIEEVSAADGSFSGNRGNSDAVNYEVYGESFSTNQTDMIGNIFSRVLERHPDKLAEAAEQTYVVALEDYSKVPRTERPAYFATLNTYELNGQTYSVGAGLKMQDKLKQVARLLALCGEPVSAISVQGYEIPELRGPGRAKRIDMDDFMD